VKPIAPGAKLDVVAFANGTEDKLVITRATSSQPGVLAIDKVNERSLVLKAGVPGVGYPYAPVRVEPDGALDLVPPAQGASVYTFRTPTKRERVTIRSTVDDTSVSVPVIERGELKDAALLDCGGGPCSALEGDSFYAAARVRFGDTPVCSQSALTMARSLTPEICSVTTKLDDDDDDDGETNRQQLAIVNALKFGICKYEMTCRSSTAAAAFATPARRRSVASSSRAKLGRSTHSTGGSPNGRSGRRS
jgi:hypothetical protein